MGEVLLGKVTNNIIKSANNAGVFKDHNGLVWIRRSLANNSKLYSSRPLYINEMVACETARLLQINIPETVAEAEDILASLYSGNSLYELMDQKEYLQDVFSTPANMQMLALILAHAWLLGDYDRTVNHILVNNDNTIWSIDYEFCGPRQKPDNYPDINPQPGQAKHFSCIHWQREKRPISPRLRKMYPELPPHDVYPWNAAALLFVIKECGCRITSNEYLTNAAQAIAGLSNDQLKDVCERVCKDPGLSEKYASFIISRKQNIVKNIAEWKTFISLVENQFIR